MARKTRGRRKTKRRTKTLTQRVSALEKAIMPRRQRGRKVGTAAIPSNVSEPKYIGAYRVPG